MKWSVIAIFLLGACSQAFAGEGEERSDDYKDIPRVGSSYRRYKGPRVISGLEFIPGGNGYYNDKYYNDKYPGWISTGGVTYIRYGRSACPDTKGTELLYRGRVAGTGYTQKGGGTEYLCLPENPDFLASRNGGHRGYLYQAEYETNTGPSFQNVHDYDVPCATCLSTRRGAKIMIPGKITCTKGWTREYYGYLMTAFYNHAGRMQYACVDVNAEGVSGTQKNSNGALLYHVEVPTTGSLPSTYISGNEITCVVCTK